ncbi:hypothetical protein [Polyangium mundeleinium]|uniref:Uncharacterized protein n=1 Tax=Polyangium mundeleinium TaxID=2995306 RepID=A0ABT5F525_9BACT|nr:hypothetical protein [Polyangium mundeleinium]MDC0749192.1 hypothetical protein [Polyangium mundeleinium]
MRYPGVKLLTASVVALATPATPAMADDTSVDQRIAFRLAYVVPADVRCPTEAALAELTSAKFRYDVFPESARASLSVTVRRAGGQLEAVLTARDEQGTLQWEETATPRGKCIDLVEDVALMVAARFVTVKGETPEAWTLLAPPAPPEAPKPPPPSMAVPLPQLRRRAYEEPLFPPSTPSTPSTPSAPDGPPFRTELSAAAVFGPFDTPNVALGGAFQVAIRWEWVTLGAELRGVIDLLGEVEGVPVRTSLATGAVVPCLVLGARGRICTPISAGWYQFNLGDAFGKSDGIAQPFFGAGLRGSYDHPVATNVWVRGYLELLFAGTRSEAAVFMGESDAQRFWSTPGFLPSFGIGVTWQPSMMRQPE